MSCSATRANVNTSTRTSPPARCTSACSRRRSRPSRPRGAGATSTRTARVSVAPGPVNHTHRHLNEGGIYTMVQAMKTTLRPLHDRILVKRLEEGDIKRGSIVIPDTAKEKPQEGKIVAVGTGK